MQVEQDEKKVTKAKKPRKKKKERKKKNTERNSFIRNIPIGYKYLSVFFISVILFLAATVIVYVQLTNAKNTVSDSLDKGQLTNDMAQLALHIEQLDSIVANYMVVGSSRYINDFNETSENIEVLFDEIGPHFLEDEEKDFLFLRVTENHENIKDIFINQIAVEGANEDSMIYSFIQVGTAKASSVALMNQLIDAINIEQREATSNANDSMNSSIIFLVSTNIVSILIGIIIMVILTQIISRYLTNVVQTTTEIANGNLSVAEMTYRGNDEIGKLTSAVNTLRNSMRNVLQKVSDAAGSVASSSEILTLSAREVKAGSDQMVVTMEELASGAETQANSASDLAEKMNEFVDSVQISQQEGQDVANNSEDVLTITEEGASLMRDSVKQMGVIDTIVSEAVEKVRGLDEQSSEISQLVEVVKDIADQTNLLALNAAIEAARAGEHGRGFAVVADEVRQLAEEVTSSVAKITNIVDNIQAETSEVVDSLNTGYSEVKEGISQIEQTGESFKTIDHSVSTMVENILNIANRLKDIANNSQQMNNLIEDIAAVSEQAAAGVQQSSASTQQTSSAMDEITNNAEELAKLAQQLNEEISYFKQ